MIDKQSLVFFIVVPFIHISFLLSSNCCLSLADSLHGTHESAGR